MATPVAPNSATPLKADNLGNLDTVAFAEGENGVGKLFSGDRAHSPAWVMWTERDWPGHSGLWFGGSKAPGLRHVRIGFKTPLALRTVLARRRATQRSTT